MTNEQLGQNGNPELTGVKRCRPLDVACTCGAMYCFSCKQEAHRPVDCDTVKTWQLKNSAESENLTWIMANTKPCPSCGTNIQKNQGCMHMTCSKCRHEFCWLCGGKWATHGSETGGYYACNRCAPCLVTKSRVTAISTNSRVTAVATHGSETGGVQRLQTLHTLLCDNRAG